MVRLKCRYILIELIYIKETGVGQIMTKDELYACIRENTLNFYGEYGLASLLQLFKSSVLKYYLFRK